MANARDDRQTRSAESAEADAPGKFFLAVFESSISESRIFRAYPEADGISFVYAGPVLPTIDPETARGKVHGDWKTKAAEALKGWMVGAGGAACLVFGVFILIAGRLFLRGRAADATDLLSLILIILTMVVVGALVGVGMAVRRLTKRVAHLETMTRDDIRREAETEKRRFRATAENTREVIIDPPPRTADRKNAAGRLSLRHDPTGKWKLNLVSTKDVRAAARAFRQLLGKDGVEINVAALKD